MFGSQVGGEVTCLSLQMKKRGVYEMWKYKFTILSHGACSL